MLVQKLNAHTSPNWITVAEQNYKEQLHISHIIQIIQRREAAHMQRIDHHTLTRSYLHFLWSWQKHKNGNTELDIKPVNPFYNNHAGMRDKINSRHGKKVQKAMHHLSTWEQARSLACTGWRKRKTGDKEADLLCCALLRGMACFDSK